MRKIETQALNVRIFPHPKDAYRQLLRRIYESRTPVKVYGNTYIALTSLNDRDEHEARGMISKFTNIESDNWFDAMEFVESEDGPQIPSHLFANLKTFRFVFNYKYHVFMFESYDGKDSMSWRFVDKYFRTISELGSVSRGLEHIEIDLIKDQKGLDELFDFERLSKINITINRPTPDLTNPDRRKKFQERLNEIKARQLKSEYNAIPHESIQPDESIKEEAEVALTDGKITTAGYDGNGLRKEKSSAEFPMTEQDRFDADTTPPEDAFRRLASRMLDKIAGRIRPQA